MYSVTGERDILNCIKGDYSNAISSSSEIVTVINTLSSMHTYIYMYIKCFCRCLFIIIIVNYMKNGF